MTHRPEASQWRIDLATELSEIYSSQPGVKIIVLGGSPSRGLSDAYSDVDMIIYWDAFDEEFIDSQPLKPLAGKTQLFLDHRKQGSMMELYVMDTLIFEVGHITIESWDQMVEMIMDKHDINPMIQKSLGGFLDSHVIYGHELAAEMKDKVRQYPEELAKVMVRRNLGFFWKDCVRNQGLKRNEVVFFFDAITQTVKRLLAVLSGLNRRYFSLYEPRWIEYELSNMTLKPENMWPRIQELYEIDKYEALTRLDELIEEVVLMARTEFPDLDYSSYESSAKLIIQATPEKPVY